MEGVEGVGDSVGQDQVIRPPASASCWEAAAVASKWSTFPPPPLPLIDTPMLLAIFHRSLSLPHSFFPSIHSFHLLLSSLSLYRLTTVL